MSSTEQIKFRTDICYVPSLGILKSADSTQKLNLSEQYILTHLIENYGRPVTKDELLKAGWPDRIVTEASLFQVIRALRVKLHEEKKGDIIETLPRVGYQVRDFIREEVNLNTNVKSVNSDKKKSPLFIGCAFSGAVAIAGLSYYFFPEPVPTPAKYIITEDVISTNQLTLIGKTKADIVDLRTKTIEIYKEHKMLFDPSLIINRKVVGYKNNDLYSFAWCRLDKQKNCIENSDFSYTVTAEHWEQFSDFLSNNMKTYRETPIIQTELAREPTAQSFMNYLDGSGIHSKVIHYYISKEQSGALNFSFMSFITENNSDYHHALSIRAASIQEYDKAPSQFLKTMLITPEMFHWSYQPSKEIIESKSIALTIERKMQDTYLNNRPNFSYLVYQQDYLNLFLNDKSGLYWLHNSEKNYNSLESTVDPENTYQD
ncbi:winged helix-turn-helix domain-containing protein [Photobacterium frigidiphilum]|uniref:winged helix-turn-helix domain-containing protein n=1 Tax=Photobacterium frigidiphilum TaxID=264736 RepID=UPI003D0CC5B4